MCRCARGLFGEMQVFNTVGSLCSVYFRVRLEALKISKTIFRVFDVLAFFPDLVVQGIALAGSGA